MMSADGQIIVCPNCSRENPASATYCSRCGASLAGEVDPLIGKTVGKYVIEQRIGAGGSGTVYRGAHADLGRRVAIKVLLPNLVTDDESQARFEREAKVLAGMEHENIVTIIDVGYVSGVGPYMVMEWLEGVTLFEARRQRGFLEFHEILPVFDQLTSSLSYMHRQGVVHRDLKPENMMLVARGGQGNSVEDLSSRLVKLYDFGIALFTAGDDRKLTAAGMVVGTPHYMAPEQIIVDAPVDYRADIYAVGAILFELISGRPPFWGAKRPVEVMERHLRHDPPNLVELLPNRSIPQGIQGVIRRVLAKKPGERFQDARELYEALEAAINGPSYEPYSTNDVDDKTIVKATDLWNVPALADSPRMQQLRREQEEQARLEQQQNAQHISSPPSVIISDAIPMTIAEPASQLPFPPLGSQNQPSHPPAPSSPSPPNPWQQPNPVSPTNPFQVSSQPPAPANPFASPHTLAEPSGHGMVPSVPQPFEQSGVGQAIPAQPQMPVLDSAPTTPGYNVWELRGGKTTELTASPKKSGTKRWLFGMLILGLGAIVILAFYFWAQWNQPT